MYIYTFIYKCMYVCMYACTCMHACMHACMYVYRAGFKKQKVIHNFLVIAQKLRITF